MQHGRAGPRRGRKAANPSSPNALTVPITSITNSFPAARLPAHGGATSAPAPACHPELGSGSISQTGTAARSEGSMLKLRQQCEHRDHSGMFALLGRIAIVL